jgi:tripeptide aminopeptidase
MSAVYTSPLAAELAAALLERFDRYARVFTSSARDGDTTPSTPGQFDLARMLVDELRALGLGDAAVDEHSYVTATLSGDGPPIGLIAHLDTSPDAPGEGVEPIVHRTYQGGVIELPRGGTVLDPQRMPELRDAIGHDIVTSSGDTLLGADDKAGIAAIMTAVAHLVAHPQLPRPTLNICFTPDEEIGSGAGLLDLDAFGARFAYTVDGSTRGELQDETFTAAEAVVTIEGHDVHPGFATGKLVNAARLLAELVASLPADRTPEATSGRDGFIHVYELEGTAARAQLRAILRDFDDDLLEAHADVVRAAAERIAQREPRARVDVSVRPQYPNMRRFLEPHPEIVSKAEAAIRAEGIEPLRTPIRGGTDGSLLSARGLPTPNIFDGGHEYHSVREWASVQDMAAAAAVLVRLAAEWAGAEGIPPDTTRRRDPSC